MNNGEHYSDPTADAVVRKEMKEYYAREKAKRRKEATLANKALEEKTKRVERKQETRDERY